MKTLHKSNLFCWSVFDEERNVDFHSVFWTSAHGNVAIDPLPLSEHDRRHMEALGGLQDIVITNSDHVRGAAELAALTGARVWGPALELDRLRHLDAHAAKDGQQPIAGLEVFELHGSKTPGELAFLIEHHTLVVGDLVRGQRAGRLNLLPDAKLTDRSAALKSLSRLTELSGIDAVLVGDGWPVFHGGRHALNALLIELEGP
jgi:metallo-beta-lactamase superfamily protein